jgi:anti-sigma B factor antagonist
MVFDMVIDELSPGIIALCFTGRLVLGNRLSDVEHAILKRIRQGHRRVLVDLSGLEFIESAGIGMLAVWSGVTEREGGKLAVAGATGQVEQMLELSRLDRVLGLYPAVEPAHNALAVWTPVAIGK